MCKTNFKRNQWIGVLLLIAMILSGCGTTETPSEDTGNVGTETLPATETETVETMPSDGIEDIDMDGYSLTFLGYDGSAYWWSRNQIDATELTGDAVNDSIFNRNATLEARFNAQIQEKRVQLVETDLKTDVLAGATDYQVAMVNDQSINSCLVAGILQMWNDMPGCVLENPWWNADANKMFQISGLQYAAVGDFNLSEYSKSYMVFFNKDLYATQNSVDDLYKTAFDGKWTYDVFLTLAEQYTIDLDGNGIFDVEDQYGIAGQHKVVYQQLVTGAGIKFIEIDEENNPYFAVIENENAINIIQKISEDFGKTNAYLKETSSAVFSPMFYEGQVVFLLETVYDTEYYRAYDVNVGMLPSPKWNEAQENYYSITVGGVVSALPKTLPVEEMEYAGTLMEAMAFASRHDTLNVYKKTVLQGKYSNDEESADMVDIIFDSQTYDLGVTIWDVRGSYVSRIFSKNSTDVASATQSISGTVSQQIQKTIKEVVGN